MKKRYSFNDLLDIMEKLRSDKGCPWDREQTHESLKRYLIEETYEVLEAIDLNNTEKMIEELGDLLLQIVFHCQIGREENRFDIEDVIDRICRKMIERHPHVFGDIQAETAAEVLVNWEKIKKKEKGAKSQTDVLKDVPRNLPALMRAYKVQQKAAQVGFDWDNINDVLLKVQEELDEVKGVLDAGSQENIDNEMGDLFFAAVNLARFAKVHPELSLTQATEKFISRFEKLEAKARQSGNELDKMTLAEMDALWNQVKEEEKNNEN